MVTIDAKHDRQMPGTLPAQAKSGTTAAMTGTTSTLVIAAPGAGLRLYVTAASVANEHATVGTGVALQAGDGGTTLWVLAAGPVGGGDSVNFWPTPLALPLNTGLYAENLTTGADVIASATAYAAQ